MKKKWLLPIFASFMIFTSLPTDNADAATQTEVITTAKQYLGVPYKYGGTTASGFDCSGFTSKVFSELGVKLNRTSSAQYSQGTAVSKGNLKTGDLVFFNTTGRGVSHVAIYIGNGQMIGAENTRGIAIASINSKYWGPKYVGAKRVADFDEKAVTEAVAKAQVKSAEIDFTLYASREQVAVEIAKALNLDTSNTDTGFADVKSSHPNAGAIAAVKKAGIFNGDENGKFNPSSPITRSHIALVLVNAFNLQQGDQVLNFSDVPSNHFAANAIKILASNGITSGKADGSFGVSDYVTHTHLDIFIKHSLNSN